MVASGRRERAPRQNIGASPGRSWPSQRAYLEAGLGDAILAGFRSLNGQGDPPHRLVASDMSLDGVAVEFDEEAHFNRYRLATLANTIYARLPSFPLAEWVDFCKRYESDCLKGRSWGRFWTGPSSERQFGQSPVPGTLTGGGLARWRQRAFYDFLKDLSPLAGGPRLARVAVWEAQELAYDAASVRALIVARTAYP